MEMINPLEQALIASFFITAGSAVVLATTQKWHGKHSLDTTDGVQKFHVHPTTRIGGVAIVIGLLVACFLSPRPVSQLLSSMLIAGLPAFISGFAEDLTKRVSIRERLLSTMLSGIVACWLTGYSLKHIDIYGVDFLLAYLPVSIAFTAFAVAGVANSVNIIDGFNGLAAGTIMICFSAFGFIAWKVGDLELVQLCLIFLTVGAGFFVINFPFGKIFMGDGGAYLFGFMLAWVAVMLPVRNAGVSVWASLLVCAYPILETGFSIWRRHHRNGHHPGQADSLHLHSLLYCRVARFALRGAMPQLKNSLTSVLLWPFSILCALVAILSFSDTTILAVSFIACGVAYRLIYLRLTQFVWCLKPATLSHK
jgi:UDP-N-acetylmuramyl pentapeptide phosphotransferase/UDP-N-acetylglucosamine-1-phosphate transferase